MFKIALQGMKGRKKDSLLLCTILMLSIVFVICTVTFFSSAQHTKQDERFKTFGTWRSLSVQEKQDFQNTDASLITLGTHEQLGSVGAPSNEFMDANNHLLKEGRWPEAENEVVLEHSAIAFLNNDFKVGDTLEIPIDITLMETSETLVEPYKFYKYQQHQLPIVYDFIQSNPNAGISIFAKDYENIYFKEVIVPKITLLSEDEQSTFLSNFNLDVKRKLAKENLDKALFDNFTHARTLRILFATETPSFVMETKKYSAYNIASTSSLKYWLSYTSPEIVSSDLNIDEDKIIENSVPLRNFVTIKKSYKVVGLLNNYTSTWTADATVLPNIMVSPKLVPDILNAFYENTYIDAHDFNFDTIRFQNDDSGSVKNQGAYPDLNGHNEKVLMYGILSLIFIATLASVFQTYMTQMKRRKRRLLLLRSIGATRFQLIRILICEMLIVILISLPISIGLGLLLSFLSLQALNGFTQGQLIFLLNPSLVAFGSLLSIVSVFLGTCLPLLAVQKTPLTGTIRVTSEIKKRRKHDSLIDMNFKSVTWLRFKRDSKKNLVTLMLYSIAITTLMGTFIGTFISFTPYIDHVLLTSKPDYSMDLNHGLSFTQMNQVAKIIHENENILHYELIKEGENAYFYHERLKFNKPFTQWAPIQVYRHFSNIDADQDYLIKKSMPVTLYGVDLESQWFQKIMNSGAMNTLDVDAFREGRETILLLPKYNGDAMSFSIKKHSVYNDTYAIDVGDYFNLTIATEDVDPNPVLHFKNDATIHEVKVGAIVNSFEDEGLWPISDAPESPIVVTSYEAMNVFFPYSAYKPNMDRATLQSFINTQRPTSLGKSHLYVYAKDNPDYGALEITMRKLGTWLDASYNTLYVDKYNRYNHSLRLSMLVIVLGFSVSLITLLILYNNNHSKVEHEREHIGVLQALGATSRAFKGFYLIIGIGFSFLSLMIAYLVNAIILKFAFRDLSIASWNFGEVLWAFPLKFVGLMSLIFIVLATLVYYVPLKKIIRFKPIENINALQK